MDYGFLYQDIRLSKVSKLGDPLEKINSGINFEIFKSLLEKKLSNFSKDFGGRLLYDYVLMFKILILQRYHNLSDEQVEFQINDRGEAFYADNTYTGKSQEEIIQEKEMENRVCEKEYRNKLLTEGQKANNTEKTRFRSCLEHIFGFMEMSMNEMYIQNISVLGVQLP
jgi:hypothetical protein